MRPEGSVKALLLALSFAACVRHADPFVPPPVAPDGPARPEVQAILTAALHWNHPSEGDITLRTDRITGQGEQGNRARVILLTKNDSAPSYHRAWLDSLVASGVIDGTCYTRRPDECADSTMASFLRLSEPAVRGDSAVVHVDDEGENPRACRSPDHESFWGFSTRDVILRRDGTRWRVTDVRPGMSGSGTCGHPPPKEAARRRRLARVDSIVTHTPSAIAGTYRFVVAIPGSDSAVLFSRTARYPRNTEADRGDRDIVRDVADSRRGKSDLRYVGYDIDAVCSIRGVDLRTQAGTFDSTTDDCYHTVTLVPVAKSRDSTTWRGWSEMEVEIYLRLRNTAIGARLVQASEVADEDSSWTFYPGFWTRFRDGRVRFTQTMRHNGTPVLTITGSRVSLEVLNAKTKH